MKKVAPGTESEGKGIWMQVSFAPESGLIIDSTSGPGKQLVADKLIKSKFDKGVTVW